MSTLPIRRAVAVFLPLAVLATLGSGLLYVVVQQELRWGANDPQIQLAEDAARALDAGATPAAVAGTAKVDVAASLSPFIVVYDASGGVLAAGGQLDGADPVPPLGVLGQARTGSPSMVTWQPRSGVRIASVTVAWRGGTVLAGRSLREVERREDLALLLVGAGWAAIMAAVAVASLVAARVWPEARTGA